MTRTEEIADFQEIVHSLHPKAAINVQQADVDDDIATLVSISNLIIEYLVHSPAL